jgi:fructokinase
MIVVCGEALMDVFAAGDTPSGIALDARVGGSPFNVAVGLARLQQEVAFFGALSTDVLGERLRRALASEGVDTRLVARVDAPTTLGLVGSDANGVPSYAFLGERGADRQLGADALRWSQIAVEAIHVGSFATVVEPVSSTLRALVERERGRALISYDVNVRFAVEADRARWKGALAWHLPRTDLLKLSEEDLAALQPRRDADAFAAHALRQGVRLVAVTRGAAGVTAWTDRHKASVEALAVPVVDTVGAGDSFQAALLSWLKDEGRLSAEAIAGLDEQLLVTALRYATRAAAVTCSRQGADLPHRGDLAD